MAAPRKIRSLQQAALFHRHVDQKKVVIQVLAARRSNVMKLRDVEEAKNYYSGKTSDITRQLTFAGVAIVWLLRDATTASPVPTELLPVLIAYVSALALDIIHYTTSTFVWTKFYFRLTKQEVNDDDNFNEPRRINLLGYLLFAAKIVAFLYGSIRLIVYLIVRWNLAN